MGEYISTSLGPLHWEDYGGSDNPLVLVHGLGGSIANWDAIGSRLKEIGHTVALDLPGFGLSPPWQDWELTTHAMALTSFIERMGSPVTLMGNSMGGLISEMVAASRPDLVDRLVLVAPATPPRLPDPRLHWPTARRLAIQATPALGEAATRYLMSRYSPDDLVRFSLQNITHKPGRVPLSVVGRLVQLSRVRYHLPWSAEAIPKTGRSIAKLFVHKSRFVEMVRRIKAPTIVVQGVADHIVSPTSVEWLCSLRLDWELIQMEDTGHTPQMDAPIRFLGIVIPWLQGTTHEREISA